MGSQHGFPRVLAAEAVSNFGSMLSRLAIPWIAALLLQASPLQMGWLLVADVLAGLIGSLWLGGRIDRSPTRAVMVLCDLLRAAVLAALALLAWQQMLTFTLLVLAAAASGVLTMGFELARSAWMAQRVEADDLPRRNAQLSVTGSLSETLAFAIGGWLFQALGGVAALVVDAASYAVSALCLRGVGEVGAAAAKPQPEQRWWHDVAEGLRAILSRPELHALAGLELLIGLAMSLSGTSYMIFVSRDIGFPTGALGMIFAAGGLGAVVGGMLAPALGRRVGSGAAIVLGLLLLALGTLCVPLVMAATWAGAALLVAQQVVGDAGHTVYNVHDRSLRQTAVPADLLARADAGLRGVGLLATLVGALGGGWLADVAGTRFALFVAAALAAAAAALAAIYFIKSPSR